VPFPSPSKSSPGPGTPNGAATLGIRPVRCLKILGVFAVLLGVAVMIRPSRNPMADSIVATHSLSSRGSGLQLEPPRLVGLSLVDPIHRIHPSPAGVLNPAVPLQASIEQVLGKRGAGGTDHGPGFSSMIH